MGWLYHWLGLAGTGPVYGFWSGFGSDVGQVTLIGAMIGVFRHHNCHVRSCPRIGRYPIAGGQYKVCAKHHPDDRVRAGRMSAEAIREVHRDHYN